MLSMLKSDLATLRGVVDRTPLFAQWFGLAAVKSLAASLVMSLVANYATAAFSVRHGFRVPVEGVPYLSFAIGLSTFLVSMGAMALFALIMILLFQFEQMARGTFIYVVLFYRHFRGMDKESSREAGRSIARRIGSYATPILGSKLVLLIAVAIYCFGLFLLLDPLGTITFPSRMHSFLLSTIRFNPLLRGVEIGEISPSFSNGLSEWVVGGSSARLLILFSACMFYSSFFMAVWCAARGYGWMGAQAIATIAMVVASAFMLFVPDVYGSFLRVIRSGGGIDVSVGIREKPDAAPVVIRGSMLLLSHTTLIMATDNQTILEFPLREVSKIEYGIHPGWSVPSYDSGRQYEYIDLKSLGRKK